MAIGQLKEGEKETRPPLPKTKKEAEHIGVEQRDTTKK